MLLLVLLAAAAVAILVACVCGAPHVKLSLFMSGILVYEACHSERLRRLVLGLAEGGQASDDCWLPAECLPAEPDLLVGLDNDVIGAADAEPVQDAVAPLREDLCRLEVDDVGA